MRTIFVYRALFPEKNRMRETFEIADNRRIIAAGIEENLVNNIAFWKPRFDELQIIPFPRTDMDTYRGNGSVVLGLSDEQVKKLARCFGEESIKQETFEDQLAKDN